jgi:hypothetical protein
MEFIIGVLAVAFFVFEILPDIWHSLQAAWGAWLYVIVATPVVLLFLALLTSGGSSGGSGYDPMEGKKRIYDKDGKLKGYMDE